ncbi:putative plant UBX domain-containing protein 14 [Macadamia integrifolia]|uniref:putative plant UBX domain-containing protein 14 n=1 Tax=Macadamia integrifolia TaxID=60698 RepID=UPI001C4FA905|nr:putative plant UBX domain-containing protein 14 [Macadamia integrifolia]
MENQTDLDVRPSLPVIRDTLYDYPYSDFDDEEEEDEEDIWVSPDHDQNLYSNSNLATLYRPPLELMFQGSFHEAKVEATGQDKWLLVNLQSMKEFESHVMNRDLWSNETIAEMIKGYFLFWQAQDDTVEGMKVSSFYRFDSLPVILVIDPITGQKMRLSKGMVEPDYLMDLLSSFMENGPKSRLEKCSMKEEKKKKMKMTYPPLPEEPKNDDTSLICRVGVRLPDGRRFCRSFLRNDPIQILWSFCCSKIEEAKISKFELMVAIPGNSKRLDYESKSSFVESGISNSIISLVWE